MSAFHLRKRNLTRYLPQSNRILNLGTAFTFLTAFQLYAGTSYSQTTTLSLSLKNATLEQAIDRIEEETGYSFLYADHVLDVSRVVNLEANNKDINLVLSRVFDNMNVDYKIVDKQIILSHKLESIPLAQQQGHTVQGVVLDSNQEPVIGANVLVKGTTVGTITDIDGRFTLEVPDNAVLVVSYIGYLSTELVPGSKTDLTISLKEDSQNLDEVVVVGYGVSRKKDLTGAVSVLKIDDLKDTPVSSVDQMMQGKLSGVNVMPDNMPGGGVAVRIRGFSTIRNNDPLYIIDGIPVDGGINFLNPNDIESMQVLKDASSASIYGARAANGVVIINTKRGKEGEFNVNLDAYFGVQKAAKQLRMLNAQQFGDMLWQAMKNDGKTPSHDIYGNGDQAVVPEYLDSDHLIPSDDVDWVDEILRAAVVQSYNLSFTKADKKSNQLFSLGYYDQQGLVKFSDFQRVSGRFNSEYKLFDDHFRIGENISLSHSWGTSVSNNAALGGTLYEAYKFQSITPVKNLEDEYAGNVFSDIPNPMGKLYRNKDNQDKKSRLVGNLYAELHLFDGLMFKTSFGVDYNNLYRCSFSPKYDELNASEKLSSLSNRNAWNFNWVFTNTLTYNKTFGDHTINALLGMESLRNRYEYFTASRDGFPSDDPNFRFLDAGDVGTQKNSGAATEYSMVSYFGKLDYNYHDRYLVAFTLRRDGSSRLGNNKWGNFPAASVGWRISNEPFFDVEAISNLKVRVGWGQNGNSDVPSYATIDSYKSNSTNSNYPIDGNQSGVDIGLVQTRNGNVNLKWETTTQTNVGVDLGFLNGDLNLTLDYFNKDTKDLLWRRALPASIGGTNMTVWDNVGKMNNKGFEMEINYQKQINQDFGFSVAYNFSVIKNKMTELNGVDYIGLSSSELHGRNFDQETSRSAVGQPIGSFFVYEADGLFQSDAEIQNYKNDRGELLQPNAKPGDIRFKDLNGDGVINSDDRDFKGNPLPDCSMGLTLGFNYKNFDVSAFFQGVFGNEVYNLTNYLGEFYNQAQYNKNSTILDAWRPDNTDTDIPRVTLDDPNNNIRPSTYYIHNASFVRLKNLKVGYTLPDKVASKLKLKRTYIYLQGQNLFTITGYEGIDPEVGLQSYSSENRNLDMGVDRGVYPLPRTFTLGVNVSF